MAFSLDRGGDDDEGGGGTSLADINVTPLVDVMLVLLVIFMVTAPLINQSGVNVNLPTAKSSSAVPQQSESAVITVRSDGIWIDDRRFSRQEFDSKFEAVITARAPKEVYLRGDRDVPYGEVMRVMDELRGAGITKVGMITTTETASNK